MRFHIPIKLPSLANVRWHWSKLARVKKKQKTKTKAAMRDMRVPPLPLLVIITRVGPSHLDDDNLEAACKYVRDQIAAVVGVDDGSSQYTWMCRQRKGNYGVDVEIMTR